MRKLKYCQFIIFLGYSETCLNLTSFGTNFGVLNKQISYNWTLLKVQFMQDFVLFRVCFRKVSLYCFSWTPLWFNLWYWNTNVCVTQLVFGINPKMLYFIPRYRNLFSPTINFSLNLFKNTSPLFPMAMPMYLPEMVSYDIAVIAKLMLWDTMFDKARHRL
jgi:hypothetical protein